MFTACMWYPVGHDDFSVMGDDVFSNLIRNSSVLSSDPNTGTDRHNGVAKLDPKTMTQLSREIFLGKKSSDIIRIFSQAQGHCDPNLQINILYCNAVRQWRLKNVGAPTDISRWKEPAAKLVFHFTLSEENIVNELDIEIKDLTQW